MEWANNIGVPYWWLLGGMALIALEAFSAPGIGLMFAGLAAIIVGVVVALGWVLPEAQLLQFALWFGLTVLVAWGLWKPLKRWRTSSKHAGEYSNMVGSAATVCEGDLQRGRAGKARWSGTVMNAELDASSAVDAIREGEVAEIVSVDGNTLRLRPR